MKKILLSLAALCVISTVGAVHKKQAMMPQEQYTGGASQEADRLAKQISQLHEQIQHNIKEIHKLQARRARAEAVAYADEKNGQQKRYVRNEQVKAATTARKNVAKK